MGTMLFWAKCHFGHYVSGQNEILDILTFNLRNVIPRKIYSVLLTFRQKEGEPHQEATQRVYALHERNASRGASRMYA